MKINIYDIEFSYNGTPALSHITSHVNKGDFLALVGPNGSGKSTLIKCINGILKTQKGAIAIDDKKINKYAPADLAKEMAYVPQNDNQKAVLNVFDTVLLGRKPYISWRPSKNDLEVTAYILKTLHLENVSMKPTSNLSGGQQQAVYIARALAQEPDILLLDEPTANLDIKHQVEVLELLKKLSAQGITIVIALHDINMAIRYASKIMMLKEGKIFANGNRDIITTDNIENLYDIKVRIIKDKEKLFVIPDSTDT